MDSGSELLRIAVVGGLLVLGGLAMAIAGRRRKN